MAALDDSLGMMFPEATLSPGITINLVPTVLVIVQGQADFL
jgi:hypothetical protein